MNNSFRKSTLVLSTKDPASMTMLKRLKKRQNFDNIEENRGYSKLQSKNMTVIVLDEEMIYCDNIEDIEDSDRFVFLSRHVSQSKKMPYPPPSPYLAYVINGQQLIFKVTYWVSAILYI